MSPSFVAPFDGLPYVIARGSIPPAERCHGVALLELTYTNNGVGDTIDVVVDTKNAEKTSFDDVLAGVPFTITSATKLGSNTTLNYTGSGGSRSQDIHTSCSKPIFIGQVHGDFTITDLVPRAK